MTYIYCKSLSSTPDTGQKPVKIGTPASSATDKSLQNQNVFPLAIALWQVFPAFSRHWGNHILWFDGKNPKQDVSNIRMMVLSDENRLMQTVYLPVLILIDFAAVCWPLSWWAEIGLTALLSGSGTPVASSISTLVEVLLFAFSMILFFMLSVVYLLPYFLFTAAFVLPLALHAWEEVAGWRRNMRFRRITAKLPVFELSRSEGEAVWRNHLAELKQILPDEPDSVLFKLLLCPYDGKSAHAHIAAYLFAARVLSADVLAGLTAHNLWNNRMIRYFLSAADKAVQAEQGIQRSKEPVKTKFDFIGIYSHLLSQRINGLFTWFVGNAEWMHEYGQSAALCDSFKQTGWEANIANTDSWHRALRFVKEYHQHSVRNQKSAYSQADLLQRYRESYSGIRELPVFSDGSDAELAWWRQTILFDKE